MDPISKYYKDLQDVSNMTERAVAQAPLEPLDEEPVDTTGAFEVQQVAPPPAPAVQIPRRSFGDIMGKGQQMYQAGVPAKKKENAALMGQLKRKANPNLFDYARREINDMLRAKIIARLLGMQP